MLRLRDVLPFSKVVKKIDDDWLIDVGLNSAPLCMDPFILLI